MKYDVIVIGSGIAGATFAKACRQYGKKVAVVEKEKLGGTAIATGCLPVKIHKDNVVGFLKARDLADSYHRTLDIDIQDVYERGYNRIAELQDFMKRDLDGIDLYFGDGVLLDQNTLKVGSHNLTTAHFIIATGTSPVIPNNARRAISHRELMGLKKLPKDLIIVGGGVEAVEIADIYAAYGVQVRMVVREEEILQETDQDLKQYLMKSLEQNQVEFYYGDDIVHTIEEQDSIHITTAKGHKIRGEYLLYTSIRSLNKVDGLMDLGVICDEHKIHVDGNLRTSVDNIYVIGDANGILGMAHVAYSQGIAVAKHLYAGKEVEMAYATLPRSIFGLKEISGIGKSEKDLKGQDYRVCKINLRDLYRGYGKDLDGFAKILHQDGKLLGYWVVSDYSSDLMADSALWFDQGCTLEKISKSLFINPSLSEVLPELYLKSIKGDE